mgnify:CR=1 FL=1
MNVIRKCLNCGCKFESKNKRRNYCHDCKKIRQSVGNAIYHIRKDFYNLCVEYPDKAKEIYNEFIDQDACFFPGGLLSDIYQEVLGR